MYIVTFTAHQQRNMVRTPHFFGAGDATVYHVECKLTQTTQCKLMVGLHCNGFVYKVHRSSMSLINSLLEKS